MQGTIARKTRLWTNRAMTQSVDYYFSFRSPYSYLSVPRIRQLANEYDVDVRVRIVLPLAVRDDTFFERVNPLWPPYLVRDCIRLAEFHDMRFHWPRPDPIVQDFATRKVAPEQPHIHRLSRLGVLAAERGRGLDALQEVTQIIWNGEVDGWNEGDHLARALARAGLDLTELDALAESESDRLDAVIETNQTALTEAGHWGVPTFVHEGEPFFGQDRIDLLVWRLEQHGLERRQP